MKIVLQAFEPQPRPAGLSPAATDVVSPKVRKPRVQLTPVVADQRLFHAWRA
jgi:hypothetical protein